MKGLLYAAPMILLASSVFAALPGDSAEGKRLHDANCVGCHDSGVYTRKARSIQNVDALKQQLESCGHAAKKQFSPTEKQNIVKYLNDQFYHFR
jgi:mono/diheme cytochrome c family protein